MSCFVAPLRAQTLQLSQLLLCMQLYQIYLHGCHLVMGT